MAYGLPRYATRLVSKRRAKPPKLSGKTAEIAKQFRLFCRTAGTMQKTQSDMTAIILSIFEIIPKYF
ncbi:hypothetical protein [Prevotella sp. OH937_COT-195]|uniref:hypothetical protein n=1 Tax=Prevotella sp. OH937_COT-195 TaxID=2491051 RepID=UPI000F648BD9|nr:hypothetical protein [Prevotella sp. OH937_COT-195]RRD00256.1 hypothetical protein EII32_07025 [Prevotella sp. OH937_COT-195]